MELRMSQKERDRLKVLAQLKLGKMVQREAGELLRISERQVRRLLRRYEEHGDAGLLHGLRGRTSNHRIDLASKEKAVNLLEMHYRDYGPTLASEVLGEEHGIWASRETVRHWMMGAELWKPRGAKVRHRQWRERKSCFGEMVQMDTSIHDWFEGRGETAVLIAIIDDATSRIFLRFYPTDSTVTNMTHLRDYIRRYGRPVSVYADRASHFMATRQPSPEEQLAGRDAETQIKRALRELDIEYIPALSPQAKGRVERLFKTLQDRLVKALRRKDIGTIQQANQYVEQEFTPHWRQHFAVEPAARADAHRSRKGFNLDAVFSVQYSRTVTDDYTFQYETERYQILKKSIQAGLRRSKIIIENRLDGTQRIRWRNQYLQGKKIEAEKVRKKAKPVAATPVGLRPPSVAATGKKPKPAHNHPWKRPFKPDTSTLQETGH
ncbi:MAG TPA: ISNCY family transposase, partial [Candidatus Bathyarchaeia archaeon]|nr:ISNCY family transposase [Candidatus Bathyarchaeia archaeon]